MSMEEIDCYIETLRALRAEGLQFVGIHDAIALNWSPTASEANTTYQLLTHMTGSEAWWIHENVGGIDVHRNRESEFGASGDDIAALKARYDGVAQRTEEILRGLAGTDLGELRKTSSDNHPGGRSVRWCIVHIIEHTARHVGHIELTSQLFLAQVGKTT